MVQAAIAAAPHNSVRHHGARASLDHSWIQPQPILSIVDFDTVSMLGNALLGFHRFLIGMLAQGRYTLFHTISPSFARLHRAS